MDRELGTETDAVDSGLRPGLGSEPLTMSGRGSAIRIYTQHARRGGHMRVGAKEKRKYLRHRKWTGAPFCLISSGHATR